MNRGVLRTDADLRNEDGAALLWTGTSSGVQVAPVAAGPVMGASVSWPASANTLTSWTEITASSPFACCAIDVYLSGHYQSAAATGLLFDIGIGPPTETVLIDGIPLTGHSRFLCIRYPIRVAASTRFAFRVQAETASGSLTTPASPTVALGFIRDIPEFPAGTSVATVGSINRGASRYNVMTALATAQRRQTWVSLGDLPSGKAVYAVPFNYNTSSTMAAASALMDFGWSPLSVAFNNQADAPDFVFAADVFTYMDTSEAYNPVIPTVWLPDGLTGGGVRCALDTAGQANITALHLVME